MADGFDNVFGSERGTNMGALKDIPRERVCAEGDFVWPPMDISQIVEAQLRIQTSPGLETLILSSHTVRFAMDITHGPNTGKSFIVEHRFNGGHEMGSFAQNVTGIDFSKGGSIETKDIKRAIESYRFTCHLVPVSAEQRLDGTPVSVTGWILSPIKDLNGHLVYAH